MAFFKKSLSYGMVQKANEVIIEAGDIKNADRLRMDSELCPSEYFRQLLNSAYPPRKSNKPIG